VINFDHLSDFTWSWPYLQQKIYF